MEIEPLYRAPHNGEPTDRVARRCKAADVGVQVDADTIYALSQLAPKWKQASMVEMVTVGLTRIWGYSMVFNRCDNRQ